MALAVGSLVGSPPWIKVERLREGWQRRWDDHQRSYVPFALYLKDPLLSLGDDEGVKTQNLIEFEMREGRPEGSEVIVPVPFEPWAAPRRELIARAEIIVVECMALSDDKLFELKTCIELGKVPQTVLILPGPERGVPLLDAESGLLMFQRVLWGDETTDLMRNPVVAGLTKALGEIVALPAESRKAYYGSGDHLRRPLTFEGVPEWYFEIAGRYVDLGKGLNLLPGKTQREPLNKLAWLGAFWHYIRAAKLASVVVDMRSGDEDSRTIAAGGFFLAARLLFTYKEKDGDRLTIGDLDYALAASRMATTLASTRADLKKLERRARDLASSIVRRQQSLKNTRSGPSTEVWFRLPIGGLSTPKEHTG